MHDCFGTPIPEQHRAWVARKGLVATITALRPSRRRTLIVAIDGYGGSGKSTLADALASRLEGCTVVRTDDFSRSNAPGWDWERMKIQVLDPLNLDESAKYQRYDWPTDALAEWHRVPVGGIVIVEGVSSMRTELGAYRDLSAWVTCSYERRLARGIARDGEAKRSRWENVWMPEEDRYVKEQKPDLRADVILDGEKAFAL